MPDRQPPVAIINHYDPLARQRPRDPGWLDLLYAFVIVRLDRRDLVWINVIANPTAEWVARQLTEAFPWNEAPHYMIRDRDRIFGTIVRRDCARWGSGTDLPYQPRLGRMASLNG